MGSELAAAKRRHVPDQERAGDRCSACETAWPCEVARLLEEVATEADEVKGEVTEKTSQVAASLHQAFVMATGYSPGDVGAGPGTDVDVDYLGQVGTVAYSALDLVESLRDLRAAGQVVRDAADAAWLR